MAKKAEQAIDMPWLRTATFNFGGEKGLETPEGFRDLRVGDEVTLLVKGTVTNLSADKMGECLGVEMNRVELVSAPNRKTIGEFLRELKTKAKERG